MSENKEQARIKLTEEQKSEIRRMTGKDVESVELTVQELEERIAPTKARPI